MTLKAVLHNRNYILIFFLIFILFSGTTQIIYAQEYYNLITQVDSSLQNLVSVQQEIKDIHPFLEDLNPVAVYEKDSLFIFDINPVNNTYEFKKKVPAPFPMPKRIRASFPLEAYSGKPACIVTKDIFDFLAGYLTIFHEFIHCRQFLTVELKLKNQLKIAREAAKQNNYSWEINHSFPYEDTIFAEDYSSFINALNANDRNEVIKYKNKLKEHLGPNDYEYLVWIEWKEGFARLIENKIRRRYKLKENIYGFEKPYNRISFYYGGEKYIHFLVNKDPGLYIDLENLFYKMFF